jgi:hypothetical protein
MTWLQVIATISAGLCASTLSFFFGFRRGKKSTIALFHELQDDGELIVLTRAQHAAGELGDMKDVIYDESDASDDLGEEGTDVPQLGPKRSSGRGDKKWAAELKQAEEGEE